MKKNLTTIFLFFYMLSSLGAVTVQHYCHVMQQSIDASAMVCCCAETQDESCHVEPPTQKSCCSVTRSNASGQHDDIVFTATSKCCETQNSYNHIETSPLPHNPNMGSDTIAQSSDILQTVDADDVIADEKITVATDPSNRLNLPLLI